MYPGANYGYWAEGTSSSGVPYDEYYLGCAAYYIFADCLDADGYSTTCAEGEADGVPDALGNGVCDDLGNGYGLNCDAWDYDACDCGTQSDDPEGACYEEPVVCDANDITVSIYGSSWCGEITWDMTDADGNVVASGSGCTDTAICIPDGTYTFNGYDSYGDGWNGGQADIVDNADGTVLYSFFMTSGDYTGGEMMIPVPEFYCGDGTCDEEESCGAAGGDEGCYLDCGACAWEDMGAPVLESYGTYHTTDVGEVLPAIQWLSLIHI